ncbi:hypothetical protein BC826DRAFT_1023651, partial [Russula brevipes]
MRYLHPALIHLTVFVAVHVFKGEGTSLQWTLTTSFLIPQGVLFALVHSARLPKKHGVNPFLILLLVLSTNGMVWGWLRPYGRRCQNKGM